ncbi:MAG: hypothetical protein R3258_09350 [Acidimicrobiia bacterium]|nr:hypothetical protein [Acidimicrobiia bacterium]
MAEGIAQLSHLTVGRTREVGRDEYGRIRTEKVCARRSWKMMDTGGNELDIPIVNGRVFTRQSWEKYGRNHVRELIKQGFLPKHICPLTTEFRDDVGGPLVAPKSDKDRMCTDVDPKEGCKHYLKVREYRRAESAKGAAARKAALSKADERSIKAMAAAYKETFGQHTGDNSDPRKAALKGRGNGE